MSCRFPWDFPAEHLCPAHQRQAIVILPMPRVFRSALLDLCILCTMTLAADATATASMHHAHLLQCLYDLLHVLDLRQGSSNSGLQTRRAEQAWLIFAVTTPQASHLAVVCMVGKLYRHVANCIGRHSSRNDNQICLAADDARSHTSSMSAGVTAHGLVAEHHYLHCFPGHNLAWRNPISSMLMRCVDQYLSLSSRARGSAVQGVCMLHACRHI